MSETLSTDTVTEDSEVDDETDVESRDIDADETEETTEETEADTTTEADTEGVTSETEITTDTTDDTTTETTAETTTEATSDDTLSEFSSSSKLSLEGERSPVLHLLPQDILKLDGRHIRSEDFSWGTCPVLSLSDIIVEAADQVQGSDLEKYLRYATAEQKHRICEKLSLDLPLNITLTLLEEGKYWERMCLKSWRAWDIWRFSDNWKSMFVHRTTQELIENFEPDQTDIWDLVENLKIFSQYVTFLRIQKLVRIKKKDITVELSSESFDEHLDDIISAPQGSIYLDFERVLESFPQLQSLIIILYPRYLDPEDLHFNVADFNSLFKGLRKLKELRKFRISNGTATKEQMITIIKLFLTHKYLTELNLSYNFVDDDICEYIGKLLISECPVESLILKYNKITDAGAKSIAAALSENSSLRNLDLSLNMIGGDGGCFLANVLLSNTAVRDLDISKNKMNADSGIAFAALVKSSTSLRSLKIQENSLGEVAGKMISKSLEENYYLLELDVHFCGFMNDDEGQIHQAILRNRLKFHYSTYIKDSPATAAEFLF